MNKLHTILVTLFSLIVLTTGCSSDDIIGRTAPSDAPGTEGFLRMSISTPAQRTSRAANDEQHNGLDDEFKIHSAVLILFEGDTSDEQEAIFHSAYDITAQLGSTNPDGQQITVSTAPIVSELIDGDKKFADKHHFVLVVTNFGNLIRTSADHYKVALLGDTIDATRHQDQPHLRDLLKFIVDGSKQTLYAPAQGILMTNAPLADHPGGAPLNPTALKEAGVHYLADVTGQIYTTEREAAQHPAVQVYLERIVAKVTMPENQGSNLTNGEIEIVDGTTTATTTVPWKLVGWKLDVTNQRTYLIRNYHTAWNALRTTSTDPVKPYRFIGDVPMAQGTQRYRTYWAVDPNYSDADGNVADHLWRYNDHFLWGNFDSASSNPVSTPTDPYPMGFGDKWPQYCLENTFDVDNMTQDRTTRIVAKVQVGDGTKDLFVVNNDKSHLYTLDGLDKKYDFDKKIREYIANDPTAKEDYELWADSDAGDPQTLEEALEQGNVTYEFGYADGQQGAVYLNTVMVYYPSCDMKQTVEFSLQNDQDNLVTILGQDLTVKRYAKGCAYYAIPIKHFGDELTPWNSSEGSTPQPGDVYPADQNREANYLGRYVLVRNNWYNVRINSIYGMGDPIVPPPSTDPDDELNNYISVGINVLSWTLRDQGADL